jgi:hypothetical protein
MVLRQAEIVNRQGDPCDAVYFGEPFSFHFRWDVTKVVPGVRIVVQVRDANQRLIFAASTHGTELPIDEGGLDTMCEVRENVLRPGDYTVSVSSERPPRRYLDRVEDCLRLRVLDVPRAGRAPVRMHREAIVAPEVAWNFGMPAIAGRDNLITTSRDGLKSRCV